VCAIQPSFDLYLRSAKSGTHFGAGHTPAVPLPADRVILGHFARHAHAQNFFQTLFSSQSSMGIAWMARCYCEALFPLWKKMPLQKIIPRLDGVDSRQTHLLHQTILQRLEQSLDVAFGLWTVRRDPFDAQLFQRSAELRTCRFSLELFAQRRWARGAKNAVFISVMRHWTSVALQPSSQSS